MVMHDDKYGSDERIYGEGFLAGSESARAKLSAMMMRVNAPKGDTIDDLIAELEAQIVALRNTNQIPLQKRLAELVKDWSTRQYNAPYSRADSEDIARSEGKDDAYHEAARELSAILAEYGEIK